MISFRQKGDFSKLTRYFERVKEAVKLGSLNKYGREGRSRPCVCYACRFGKNREFVVLRNRTF